MFLRTLQMAGCLWNTFACFTWPSFPSECVRVCLYACVCCSVPLCSEGCKCNLRHMLLRLMFFRLMSVVISISPAKTQECSFKFGLIHSRTYTLVCKPLVKLTSAAILNDCTMIIWCCDLFWMQPVSKLKLGTMKNLTDKLRNKIQSRDSLLTNLFSWNMLLHAGAGNTF